jgi:mannose-6-phosphate isomerase-like protein (cupin superfamily)
MPSEKAIVMNLNDKCEYQRLFAGRPQTCGMRSGRVYLAPGEDCGQHSTQAREELLVFLSGNGVALVDEKDSFQVGQGKVAYIPPHTNHNIKNTSKEPLIYIYCVAPLTAESNEKEHQH